MAQYLEQGRFLRDTPTQSFELQFSICKARPKSDVQKRCAKMNEVQLQKVPRNHTSVLPVFEKGPSGPMSL